jgi:beta-1,4-N-acetylglucosaminyltransferase
MELFPLDLASLMSVFAKNYTLILIFSTLFILSTITFVLGTVRLLFILQPFRGGPAPRKPGSKTHLLVVLGSGGHTAEMLTILEGLNTSSYKYRTYVVSEGDPISAARAKAFEEANGSSKAYTIWLVPRARRVYQSFLTAPYTCFKTLLVVFKLLSKTPSGPGAPDLILVNGPATSAIVVYAQLILRFLDFGCLRGHEKTRIIYIESFARIRSLSLSAKCVSWCVDRLLVQWEELAGGKAEYAGLLALDQFLD